MFALVEMGIYVYIYIQIYTYIYCCYGCPLLQAFTPTCRTDIMALKQGLPGAWESGPMNANEWVGPSRAIPKLGSFRAVGIGRFSADRPSISLLPSTAGTNQKGEMDRNLPWEFQVRLDHPSSANSTLLGPSRVQKWLGFLTSLPKLGGQGCESWPPSPSRQLQDHPRQTPQALL